MCETYYRRILWPQSRRSDRPAATVADVGVVEDGMEVVGRGGWLRSSADFEPGAGDGGAGEEGV